MRQFPRRETVYSTLLAVSLVTVLAVVVADCSGIPNDGRYQGGSNFRALAPTDSPAAIGGPETQTALEQSQRRLAAIPICNKISHQLSV